MRKAQVDALTGDASGFLSAPLDKARRVVHFTARLADRFAHFKGHELGEFFFVFEH